MAQEHVKGLLSTGEVVLIDTRQHWMALVRFALKPILLIGLVVLLVLLNQWLEFDGILAILNDLIHIILVVAILVAVIWLPIDVVRWRSRHFVLTNRRSMRMDGVFRKRSFDSSLEQINDIGLVQSIFGRSLGYADLTILTASDAANESYEQLMDGLQFKRAVLDAKEGIRVGRPLQELAEGFIVKGGRNLASMRADGKLEQAAAAEGTTAAQPPSEVTESPVEPVNAEVLAQRSDPGSGGEGAVPPPPRPAPVAPPPSPPPAPPVAAMPDEPAAPSTPEYSAPAAPLPPADDASTWSRAAADEAPDQPVVDDQPAVVPPGPDEMAAAEHQAAREAAAWPAADTAPPPSGTDQPTDDGAPKP